MFPKVHKNTNVWYCSYYKSVMLFFSAGKTHSLHFLGFLEGGLEWPIFYVGSGPGTVMRSGSTRAKIYGSCGSGSGFTTLV
jgi:hypothetical protein